MALPWVRFSALYIDAVVIVIASMVRCSNQTTALVVRVRGMIWPQTGATHYHAKLGLPDKGRAVKVFVVTFVCCSMAQINDLWDGSMDQRKERGLVSCCGQDGYRAQVLQRHIDSYNI